MRLDQGPLRVGEVAGVVVYSHTLSTSLDPLMFPLWDSQLGGFKQIIGPVGPVGDHVTLADKLETDVQRTNYFPETALERETYPGSGSVSAEKPTLRGVKLDALSDGRCNASSDASAGRRRTRADAERQTGRTEGRTGS